MRPLLLILATTLVLAGCTTPAADDVTPAAAQEPAAEPTPTSPVQAPTPAPTSPSPARPNATAPGASAPNASAPAPAPPAKVPWNLTGSASVGWLAGAGTGGATPTQGQTDAEHCPDATIVVPAGAASLRILVTGEAVQPGGPGAGQLILTLTGPDGSTVTLDPATPEPGAEAAAREMLATAPVLGEWKVHAEPFGPVVAQTWSLAIEVAGESEVAPAALAVAAGC